jgi:hypothetical protein
MENVKSAIMVMVPQDEWYQVKETQQKILDVLNSLGKKDEVAVQIRNITAMEFMAAVRIRRTKFDKLVAASKIKIIRKGRKIYVPVSEVDRFFTDPAIQ